MGYSNLNIKRTGLAFNHAFFLLFSLIAYGVVSATINIGDIALGAPVDALSGLPLALPFVWATFGLGFVFRNHKRLDTIAKVCAGSFVVTSLLAFIIAPVAGFVLGNAFVGLVCVVFSLTSYAVVVIR
ncbi:hypothetical protein KU306_12180 [Haloferax larsenii]|uniref:SPW repeat-containing protein n=1 Tax=Haloferax larsenii TaxID=302484 RepID=A0ABY5RBD6_HALLR|nr:hypothetical protein [Haloferax larsenii]UVE49662.1 hypothetical protein KU306_12180 [Haloferax larsenii]